MAKSRLSMRREVEAAEAIEEAAPATKKKTATKKATKKKATRKKGTTVARTRKKKADIPVRRRLIWVLYSSTMREEGRFLYHERDKAEEKLEALLAKGKRRYFLQPIKEPLDAEGNPMVPDPEEPVKVKKVAKVDDGDVDGDVDPDADVDIDIDVDLDADVDSDAPEVDEDLPDDD